WSPAFATAGAEGKGPTREDLMATEGILAALRQSVEAAAAISVVEGAESNDVVAARQALEKARTATAEGDWSVALQERRATQARLAVLTSQALQRSAVARKRPGCEARADDIARIDRFLSCRVVELLKEVLPQMRLQ